MKIYTVNFSEVLHVWGLQIAVWTVVGFMARCLHLHTHILSQHGAACFIMFTFLIKIDQCMHVIVTDADSSLLFFSLCFCAKAQPKKTPKEQANRPLNKYNK